MTVESIMPSLISLWRGGKGGRLTAGEVGEVSKSLLSLQRGLTGGRKMAGGKYMESRGEFGAYLLYYFPVSFVQISGILEGAGRAADEIAENAVKERRAARILEVGSGPAPGTCAAIARLRENRPELKVDCTLTDQSDRALSFAKRIIASNFRGVEAECVRGDISRGFPKEIGRKSDVIIASHVLNELWKDDPDAHGKRFNLVKDLSALLSDGGMLILNEPSTLESARSLISLRDGILESGETGLSLISPCPSAEFPCPALLSWNATCHADVSWKPCEPVSSLARGAGLDRRSVKMSFFVFRKGGGSAGVGGNGEFSVVSEPLLNKSGRIRLMLCDGLRRLSLSARCGDERAKGQGFFNLRRYDRIRIEGAEIRGDNLGFSPETKIEKIRSP